MEYELYRSKLKPLVNRTLVRNIIESSSSGEHPHHSVAIGLIFEKSIQEHYERMLQKAKTTPGPAPAPEPKTNTEVLTAPIPKSKCLVPDPAPQSVSRSSSSSALASASAKTEKSTDSSTVSEPRKKTRVERPKQPLTNIRTNPPDEGTVKLVCDCGQTVSQSFLPFHRLLCIHGHSPLKCSGCEAERVESIDACTKCHKKFHA